MAEPAAGRTLLARYDSEPVTLQQFLAHLDEDDWTEWVDGEVRTLSPASSRHQDVAGFLYALLLLFVQTRKAGKVFNAPFLMVLRDQDRAREPDVLFVHKDHLDRIGTAHLEGPADLVVEVVSPDSVSRDRGEKFVEYEAAGIPEYWLIDPQGEQAELYRLEALEGAEARYRRIPQEADGAYRSRVLEGFRLRPEWLWQDPLPMVFDVARELGILD